MGFSATDPFLLPSTACQPNGPCYSEGMARTSTLNISLTRQELIWLREGIASGRYASPNEIVREGLRSLFTSDPVANRPARQWSKSTLAEGYKATTSRDRKMAADWSKLTEAWPEK